MIYLRKGDVDSQQTIKIIDEDRLCFLVLSQNRGAQGLRTISKSLLEEFIAYEKQNPEATAQMAREALSGNSEIDKFEYGYNSTLLALAKLNKTLSKERKSVIINNAQPITIQPLQLINSDDPTQFVWSCIKLFNERQNLKQLLDSKYKSLGGSIGNYIRINECYVAQIGKSDIKEIETIQIYDGSFLNAGFDARSIEQFADAVNDVFDGRYQITISNEDGKLIYRLLVLKLAQDNYLPYLAALRTKPFMLLAGISGTGKSRIVREMAKACWKEGDEDFGKNKPSNFEMVQVKPNWHDSSEVFGYVSRIGEKPHFVAGDFLKFVAKAWEHLDKPYFLCLDEMNLAPVEQYFAEYLSVIESRKLADDGKTIYTDPILKKSADAWWWDLCCELTESEDLRIKFRDNGICLPQNLFVIGTVNMDETTYSFSRKVLDRAMTIEMNEVDLGGGLEKSCEKEFTYISANSIIGTAVEGCDVYTQKKAICDAVLNYLQAVNDKLEGTPFKIAYRTRNEFLVYAVNRLLLSTDENKDALLKVAMDEMTSMKILSRIEGERSKCVKPLEGIRDILKGELTEEQQAESVSLKKIDSMLKKGDYISYWD